MTWATNFFFFFFFIFFFFFFLPAPVWTPRWRRPDYAGYAGRKQESQAPWQACGGSDFKLLHRGLRQSRRSAAVGSLGAGVRACGKAASSVSQLPPANILVYTGAHSHGQGHETTFAQLMSSWLGVPSRTGGGDPRRTPSKTPNREWAHYGRVSPAVGGRSALYPRAVPRRSRERGQRRSPPILMEASEGGDVGVQGTGKFHT